MRPQSAKAKGRKAQQYIRDLILKWFPELQKEDVRSTSMGASGEDIQLSTLARTYFPFYVESKSRKSFTIYSLFESIPSDRGLIPLLVIRANNKKPLAVIDLDLLMGLIRKSTE